MGQFEYFYGVNTVSVLLKINPVSVIKLFLQADRHDDRFKHLLYLAEQSGVMIERLTKKDFIRRFGDDATHQGVVAQSKPSASLDENALAHLVERTEKSSHLFLVLDEIQDPHNLGACLRSADAFGVHAVIAPRHHAVGITPVVRKVASGATVTVPFIQVNNLSRTLNWLKSCGIWLVGMASEAPESLPAIDLTTSIAIVVGNEGVGMRRLTRQACDFLAQIPMQGHLNSLNVSAAVAISLYEVQRQRTSVTPERGC